METAEEECESWMAVLREVGSEGPPESFDGRGEVEAVERSPQAFETYQPVFFDREENGDEDGGKEVGMGPDAGLSLSSSQNQTLLSSQPLPLGALSLLDSYYSDADTANTTSRHAAFETVFENFDGEQNSAAAAGSAGDCAFSEGEGEGDGLEGHARGSPSLPGSSLTWLQVGHLVTHCRPALSFPKAFLSHFDSSEIDKNARGK